MAIQVSIPASLREFTDGQAVIEVEAGDVLAALEAVDARHAGLLGKLVDGKGQIRRFMQVFVGEEDVRFLQGLQTPLPPDCELTIVPAIAGGC